MKTLKISTIVLAVGFATGIGCGSDTGNKTDAPVIGGGTGGAVNADANGAGGALGTGGMTGVGGIVSTGGVPGSGGVVGLDAPLATGGTGGGLDGGPLDVSIGVDGGSPDTPLVAEAGGGGEAGTASEAAQATNICTGLSASACDQAIRNAPTENTVVAQDVPVISTTSYPACNQ